jgi:predicted dehydrogenase
MIEGNGHPYSWSAIVNGYDPVEMAKCPYAAIPRYLGAQPLEAVRIPGAEVTHVWTDNPSEAPLVAKASKIPNIVNRPEDVIGQVDAAVIATDNGDDHVRRAQPFIEAGLPIFVDKPMATNLGDLRQFIQWHLAGRVILSTSGMRYMPDMQKITARGEQLGDLRWITSFTCKTWERYGIHALEAVYPVLGPGFIAAQTNHQDGSDIVHVTHRCGVQLNLAAIHDAYGSFGAVHAYGTKGQLALTLNDTYTAFRAQLVAFLELLRTGRRPVPFSQTVELMAIIIAGIRSRNENGRSVKLREIYDDLDLSTIESLDR